MELLLRGIQPQSEIRPPNYQTFYCWSNTNARSKTATFVLYATQHPNPSQPAKYHNHIPLIPLINITSFQNTPNKNKKKPGSHISHHQPSSAITQHLQVPLFFTPPLLSSRPPRPPSPVVCGPGSRPASAFPRHRAGGPRAPAAAQGAPPHSLSP